MPMIMIRHFLHIYTIAELTIVMDGDSFQDKAKLFLAQSCQDKYIVLVSGVIDRVANPFVKGLENDV